MIADCQVIKHFMRDVHAIYNCFSINCSCDWCQILHSFIYSTSIIGWFNVSGTVLRGGILHRNSLRGETFCFAETGYQAYYTEPITLGFLVSMTKECLNNENLSHGDVSLRCCIISHTHTHIPYHTHTNNNTHSNNNTQTHTPPPYVRTHAHTQHTCSGNTAFLIISTIFWFL